MADERVQEMLAEFQLSFPQIDLTTPQRSAHGKYVYNLHVVLVHEARWRENRRAHLVATRDTVLQTAGNMSHRLSRLSLFTDHLHLTLGCPYASSPQEVALVYLNSLASTCGMPNAYMHSYYVGTFGEYDTGAIWSSL